MLLLAGETLDVLPGETVLDCLVRHQVEVKSGCKAGACQSCLVRTNDVPPAKSQKGLRQDLIDRGYFMSCQCSADELAEIELADTEVFPSCQANLIQVDQLAPNIFRYWLSPDSPIPFRLGQFLKLKYHAVERCYSIAEERDGMLGIHVRLIEDGAMSLLLRHAKPGGSFTITGPLGNCSYQAKSKEQPLLLVGSSTGLAPLYGILKDALCAGHSGPIALYHGAADATGIYLQPELLQLADNHPNFSYVPCTDVEQDEFRTGSPVTISLSDLPDLTGYQVYICGNPAMSRAMQKKAFLAGANLADIFMDPFEAQ